MSVVNLLWADDDCHHFLRPLGRILQKDRRFSLHRATTYTKAMEMLNASHGTPNTEYQAVLADIILPFDDEGHGAVKSNLGLTLADQAAAVGICAISFLTVVRQDEVTDGFKELQMQYPQTQFSYFDKTELLSGDEMRKLFDSLALNGNRTIG